MHVLQQLFWVMNCKPTSLSTLPLRQASEFVCLFILGGGGCGLQSRVPDDPHPRGPLPQQNWISCQVPTRPDSTETRRQLVGRNLGTKERPTTEPDNGWVKFSDRVGRVVGRFVLSLVWVCDVSNAGGLLLGTAVLMGSVVWPTTEDYTEDSAFSSESHWVYEPFLLTEWFIIGFPSHLFLCLCVFIHLFGKVRPRSFRNVAFGTVPTLV